MLGVLTACTCAGVGMVQSSLQERLLCQMSTSGSLVLSPAPTADNQKDRNLIEVPEASTTPPSASAAPHSEAAAGMRTAGGVDRLVAPWIDFMVLASQLVRGMCHLRKCD